VLSDLIEIALLTSVYNNFAINSNGNSDKLQAAARTGNRPKRRRSIIVRADRSDRVRVIAGGRRSAYGRRFAYGCGRWSDYGAPEPG
jgi:hypothetical protein